MSDPALRFDGPPMAPMKTSQSLLLGWLLASVVSVTSVRADNSPTDQVAGFTVQERSHWAFQPLGTVSIPRTDEPTATPIDTFVIQRLASRGLSLSPPASKRELLRRAKFDLHGLPPSPDEIRLFLGDTLPGAYERLLDRLLASPRYGEKWGRHWLDVVRFAETAGFNADPLRPLAYKYRDYVIRAFNNDTPYDEFVRQQIAGDELLPHNPEALIATGFNVLWPDESNASNVLLARQDALNDLTSSIGSVFLGLSLGCAQCHDHKFDPLLQTDFYQLQAFFAGIVPTESAPLGSHQQLSAYEQRLNRWLVESQAVRNELHLIESRARAKSARIKRLKFPAIVLQAVDTAIEDRTALQRQLSFWSERQIVVTEKQLVAQLSDQQRSRRVELQQRLTELQRQRPQPPAQLAAWVSVEVESGPPPTHLLSGGSYDDPLEKLEPGVPSILSSSADNQVDIVSPRATTSGRRSALAAWLTSPNNPLTPRVMVNRIWQAHFGQGLLANANDFGSRTGPPSHPQLLDWLAAEFIAQDWSLKSVHRAIMTSDVYRQSTYRRRSGDGEPIAARIDPSNQLYWHFPRHRLTAEGVRDAMLAIAGQLNSKMYGPGIKPELPPNFSARHGWEVTKEPVEQNRRSVYIHAKRNLPYPLLQVFDLPDMHESCARRSETTVAPQALMVLNSEMIIRFGRSFAERLWRENPDAGLEDLVRQAYVIAFGREPGVDETAIAVEFIRRQQRTISHLPQEELSVANSGGLPTGIDSYLAQALADFCHVLMNTNEFIYID